MLAGLIFATEEAEDEADMLAATLPFGGMTLLEYQARMLIAAGVGHILVAVGRVTPALLGAVSRIGKRDIAVDIVRSAEEAAATMHPLATVLIFADGLVATDVAALLMAGEAPDALLVTEEATAPASVERVDAGHCWAGIATVSADRLAEIAAMPRDYDFQSTLLRICAQAGARQVPLPESAKRAGHGVERNRESLAGRGNAVLAALANQRIGWADRYVFTPITRHVLPLLVRHGAPDWAVLVTSVVLGAAVLVLFGLGVSAVALGIALVAVASLSTGSLLSWLRGDDVRARWQEGTIRGLGLVAILATGANAAIASGVGTAAVLSVAAVAAAAIAERVPVRRRIWYANAPSGLLLLTPFAIAGQAVVGLGVIAVYALATLAGAVERSREKA